MHKFFLAAALAASLGACGQPRSDVGTESAANDQSVDGSANASGDADTFASDEDRVLYALGVVLGENIADFDLTEDEYRFVSAGMLDAVRDAPYRVDMNTYGPQIQGLADERQMAVVKEEKEASAAFADEIAAEPGAERMDSGLIFVPITEGEGEMPTADDTVSVHYTGTLRDGTVFDSSVERGQPATFPLSGVIPCWTEGVQKLKVGGKARLLCPSDIAYGDRGNPPTIPGGAALLFEVELLGIE
jgi:FKBP-type peptidyl-prolyl cis-trans isomerase FkpA